MLASEVGFGLWIRKLAFSCVSWHRKLALAVKVGIHLFREPWLYYCTVSLVSGFNNGGRLSGHWTAQAQATPNAWS